MNSFISFLDDEIEHFIIEQLILTNEIDGSWQLRIGSPHHPIIKFWMKVGDGDIKKIKNSLVDEVN